MGVSLSPPPTALCTVGAKCQGQGAKSAPPPAFPLQASPLPSPLPCWVRCLWQVQAGRAQGLGTGQQGFTAA